MTKIMFSMRIIGMYIKLWHVSDLLLVRCLKKVSRGREIEYCQSPDTAQLGRQRKVILPWTRHLSGKRFKETPYFLPNAPQM